MRGGSGRVWRRCVVEEVGLVCSGGGGNGGCGAGV